MLIIDPVFNTKVPLHVGTQTSLMRGRIVGRVRRFVALLKGAPICTTTEHHVGENIFFFFFSDGDTFSDGDI